LVLVVHASAMSQSGQVTGVVLDEHQDALSGVHVYLDKTKLGSATNSQGKFLIKNVPEGDYQLVASLVGYELIEFLITVTPGNVQHDISMREMVVNLPGVVVERVTMTGGLGGIKDIPGSAYYISPKEMQKFNYNDVQRALRTVPGVNIQEEDGFGLRPNIGMRGTGVERSSKITVMEDGVLMAPAPYAAPAAYYFPTMGRMQAVEVVKGSSQVKYGPNTTGGAINLISTQIPTRLTGNVNLYGGSYGGRNLLANVGDSYKNFGFLVETYQASSDGFKELDNDGDTGFDKKDFMAKLRVNTNPEANVYQSLTFKIAQASEDSDETYLGITDADFDRTPYRRYAGSQIDQIVTDHKLYQFLYVIRPSDRVDITTSLYRTEFERNWYKLNKVRSAEDADAIGISTLLENPELYPEAFQIVTGSSSQNDNALELKNNNRSYFGQGIQTIVGFNFQSDRVDHDIEVGIRYHQDEMDRFQWVDHYRMAEGIMQLTTQGTPGTESNRIESATALAVHALYKISVSKLIITPGLRYENIAMLREDYGKNDPERTGTDLTTRKNNVDVFIPGIGVHYEFNQNVSAFLGIHKGFSPPGTTEGTQPEASINYELGSRFGSRRLTGQLVLFMNDYQNLLGSDLAAAGGSGSNEQFNAGEALTKGVELQLTYDLLSADVTAFNLPLTMSYTYTGATFRNTFESNYEPWGSVQIGDRLPYLAPNQLTLVLGLEHRKFSFNLAGKYKDEMRTVAGQGEIPQESKLGSYFVLDASAQYYINPIVSIFGSVQNLTDQAYAVARRPAGLRPGMPRFFQLGVKAGF